MAKTTKDFTANNAKIDLAQMKIVELPKKEKDLTKVYNLEEILKEFDGIEGITFTISTKIDLEPESTKY